MVTHEGTPVAEHVPTAWRTKILHAELEVGGQMVGECSPDCGERARTASR